jgi:hypothetical protein
MTTRRLAAFTWGVTLVLAAGTLVLLALGAGEHTPADGSTFEGWGGLSFAAASLAFATVGAMVAARVPGNPIGWIFCVTGLLLGVADFGNQYADQMLFIASDPLPGGRTAAWLQQLGLAPSFGLLGLSLLLFPDGKLPSSRWRPVLWLALVGIGLMLISGTLSPGPLVEPFEKVSNPVGIPGSRGLMDAAAGFGFMFTLASVALAGLGLRTRMRRSRGLERQQFKWLAFAAGVTGVLVVVQLLAYLAAGIDVGGSATLGLGFAAFPIAAGAAILRYRLFDIDVVINRALVYGALTIALGAAYLGTVLLLQLALQPLTSDSQLAIAVSTLAVAALFRPARARIQRAVDHRFFRRRYDSARTLERFSAHVRREVELDAVSAELRSVVDDTMQPAHVSLWLRGS